MKKIRILIADDHSIVRIGLTSLLETEKDIQVLGGAENGEDAIRLTRELKPDVLLLDLMMPIKDGMETTEALHAVAPSVRILILTSFGDATSISKALRSGASGAILKSSPESDIVTAIRVVANGKTYLSDELQHVIDDTPPPQTLTPRQREILCSVVKGRTNRQIGLEIGIREDSVGQHLSAIFAKLGAVNRAEAIAIALKRQLLKI